LALRFCTQGDHRAERWFVELLALRESLALRLQMVR
jgi:hypothetical protein